MFVSCILFVNMRTTSDVSVVWLFCAFLETLNELRAANMSPYRESSFFGMIREVFSSEACSAPSQEDIARAASCGSSSRASSFSIGGLHRVSGVSSAN